MSDAAVRIAINERRRIVAPLGKIGAWSFDAATTNELEARIVRTRAVFVAHICHNMRRYPSSFVAVPILRLFGDAAD